MAGEVWRARMNRGKAERGWRSAEGLRAGRGGIVFDWSNCCRSVVHGYGYVMSAMLRAHKRALSRCHDVTTSTKIWWGREFSPGSECDPSSPSIKGIFPFILSSSYLLLPDHMAGAFLFIYSYLNIGRVSSVLALVLLSSQQPQLLSLHCR